MLSKISNLLPLILLSTLTTTSPTNLDSTQIPLALTAPIEAQAYPVGVHDGYTGWPPLPNACTTPRARVYKRSSDPHPLSTLLTFRYPTTQYKYCWLEFNAPAGVTGSGRVQVFTTSKALSCPTSDTSSFRDQYIGSWVVPTRGGNSTWTEVAGEYLNRPMRSSCPKATNPGGTQGIEVVPAGEEIDLWWTQLGREGVRLLYSN
ncbi:hypothetical protein B0T14DRAFT_496729 [Immersiella caudata]|uniref:Ubiquitin 3 binding protein But2 C-terminal domain-containing protein n=1 Tax=Immersiella caudata TaxID=314043 RepID=A0AA40C0E0_9PEZI|nr:hypothetical protein B0T14DRAFT_496729 [Immersiella caudata]